jgi:hypothetical protein
MWTAHPARMAAYQDRKAKAAADAGVSLTTSGWSALRWAWFARGYAPDAGVTNAVRQGVLTMHAGSLTLTLLGYQVASETWGPLDEL